MAKVDWIKKLNINEDQLGDLRYAGFSYLRQGKYEIATTFFEALILLDPKNPYDSQTLGALYLETGQPEKALTHFDHALKLEPEHPPTLLNLCKAFFMLGKMEEGLKLANILKTSPDPRAASVSRALILAYS